MTLKASISAAALLFAAITSFESSAQTRMEQIKRVQHELIAWVYGPCFAVTAALTIEEHAEQSHSSMDMMEMQITMQEFHLWQFGPRIIEAATMIVDGKNPPWEERLKIYPPMLRICIENERRALEEE